MNCRIVLRCKALRVEMKPESGQQKHIAEGIEMAYVGCHVVVGSVAEVGDDRLGTEEQVGGDTIDGRLTEALTLLAKMCISGVDDRFHTQG